MSTEEPAWRRELRAKIRAAMAEADGFDFEWLEPHDYQRQTSGILLLLDEHIKAAEERGRREALRALGAEIDALAGNIPNLKARDVWKAGYQGALATLSVWAKLDPDRP